jgi:hypothetical protein
MTTSPAKARAERPGSAAVVAALVEVLPGLPVSDLGDLSGDQLLDAVQGWERVVAVATAAQAACLVALRDRIAQADDAQACAARAGVTTQQQLTEEVARALHLSPVAAAGRLDLAKGLGCCRPRAGASTGAATAAGPRPRRRRRAPASRGPRTQRVVPPRRARHGVAAGQPTGPRHRRACRSSTGTHAGNGALTLTTGEASTPFAPMPWSTCCSPGKPTATRRRMLLFPPR